MGETWLAALRPLLERGAEFLKSKPELRGEIGAFAKAVWEWAEAQQSPAPAAPPVAPVAVVAETPPPLPMQPPPLPTPVPLAVPAAPVVKPLLGPVSIPGPFELQREFIPIPLATIAARCRVKGAAAKILARRVSGGNAFELDNEEEALRKQAEAIPDCGLWMFDPNGGPRTRKIWEDLSGGYTVMAKAAEVLKGWAAAGANLSHGTEVLTAAAEAQSMLLYAVADVGWISRDHEQVQMFVHIREFGKQHQIYVPRFLRREDPADPSTWPNLMERLKPLLARYGGVVGAVTAPGAAPAIPLDPIKVRQKALGNLKYKLKKVAEEPSSTADEWPRVVELLDQAVGAGVPPSSLELRELILPIYDRLPENLPTTVGAERVFRAIEVYKESQAEAALDAPEVEEVESREVTQVAEWLRGKEIVLIGGHRRPQHINALKKALQLNDVRWLDVPEHSSYTVFESDIARPEVAVVLLAIRWSSHDYAEVQKFCVRYSKPLVRLLGGYNANQVAHQILAQAAAKLALAASEGFSVGL